MMVKELIDLFEGRGIDIVRIIFVRRGGPLQTLQTQFLHLIWGHVNSHRLDPLL